MKRTRNVFSTRHFAELLTHTKQLVEAYKISEGKVGMNAEVDEETVAEIQRLAELLYSPSTYFSRGSRYGYGESIDTRLNEIDMTNRWGRQSSFGRATSHEMGSTPFSRSTPTEDQIVVVSASIRLSSPC